MDRRRGPADGAGPPWDRPARGSLAELRLRLERLPAGHPSSPYDETGARRPAPEQLRQLELPLSDEDEHHARPGLLASAPSVLSDPNRGDPRPASLAGYRPGEDGVTRNGANGNGPTGDGPIGSGPTGSGLTGTGLSGNGLTGVGASASELAENELAENGLSANGFSDGSPAGYRASANGLSGNGSGQPSYGQAASYGQDDFGPAELGGGDAELIEPGLDEDLGAEEYDDSQYGSSRYATGRDRDDHDQSRHDQADHDQAGHDQAERDQAGHDQPEPFQPGHEQPYRYQPEHDPSGHGPPGPAGNGQNGIGARAVRDEPAGNGSARLAAFGRPPDHGSRRPGDFAGGESLTQAPDVAASALPSRNGSGQHDDPAGSGLTHRVIDPGQRPARNGFRDHDDPAAPDLRPRVPAASEDLLAARNGSGRPVRGPVSGPMPRRIEGDLISPGGAGRDDPLRDDRPGTDPAAGPNSYPRRRAGLGELERARTGPSAYDPGGQLSRERPPGQATGRRHEGLTAEQETIANQALSQYQDADGHNVFGGYGESGLTPAMRRVEAQLPHGRLVPDSDQHALKSAARFKDKLARMIARHPGIPPAELAAEIYDAARYAFVFEPQEYTDGTWLVHRRLKTQGFDLEARRNRWDTPELKGIRTRWRDPAHDLAFEVQFHTPASWDVVQRTYDAYVRITDPRTSAAERSQLRERQVAAAAGTPLPARYAEIGDFRADVR